ncbi:hypothetical protein F0562_003175 [Nyssa sinensis]|uniref:Uncharacterized protein n=1 Tax=Nyssa sinensis TaxID=561372 RepID=A0A5J5BVM2_9ASTE|nr:hypothetical protein F0562_003175 [Nyssa sinensis]
MKMASSRLQLLMVLALFTTSCIAQAPVPSPTVPPTATPTPSPVTAPPTPSPTPVPPPAPSSPSPSPSPVHTPTPSPSHSPTPSATSPPAPPTGGPSPVGGPPSEPPPPPPPSKCDVAIVAMESETVDNGDGETQQSDMVMIKKDCRMMMQRTMMKSLLIWCWISVVLDSATEYSGSIAEYELRWSEDDDDRTTKGQRSVFCVHRFLVMFGFDRYREAMEIDDGRGCLLIEMIRFDCGRSPKNVDDVVGLEFSGDRVIG